MKILFIGNSHTFVHYVPARFVQFCKDHGVQAEAVMLTHPGMGLDWHLKQSQTYYNLMCGGYDAVVLQHNAHPFPGRESLLEAGEAIAALVPAGTKTFLYMTWTEKSNPQGQEAMCAAYEALAGRIGAVVCPVGRLWWPLTHAHPEADFYFADGEHIHLTRRCWGRPWRRRSSAGPCWGWSWTRRPASPTPRASPGCTRTPGWWISPSGTGSWLWSKKASSADAVEADGIRLYESWIPNSADKCHSSKKAPAQPGPVFFSISNYPTRLAPL